MQVAGGATTVSLTDSSAATQMVISGLSAAPSANVTLVSAGAMQVDAATLSPVANLTATAQNGDMVFLNSGTLRNGTPGVLATGALTLNASGALNSAADPLVINVDWDVDGTVKKNGGTTFDTSSLAAGSHTIKATAYDNAGDDLVRYKDSTCQPNAPSGWYCHRNAWKNSIQTVMWTVTK